MCVSYIVYCLCCVVPYTLYVVRCMLCCVLNVFSVGRWFVRCLCLMCLGASGVLVACVEVCFFPSFVHRLHVAVVVCWLDMCVVLCLALFLCWCSFVVVLRLVSLMMEVQHV